MIYLYIIKEMNKKVNIEYDKDLYEEDKSKYQDFISSENDPEEEVFMKTKTKDSKLKSFTAPKDAFEEMEAGTHEDPFQEAYNRKISAREDDYHKKRYRALSPIRHDPLKDFDKLPEANARTYKDVMREQKKHSENTEFIKHQNKKSLESQVKMETNNINSYKRARVDVDTLSVTSEHSNTTKLTQSEWDKVEKPVVKKWDTPSRRETSQMTPRRKRWDLTPVGDEMTPRGSLF
jgi:hypothetical protein